MDEHIERIIKDEIVEKYMSRYRGVRVDEQTKKDMAQDIYLMLLEATQTPKYQTTEDKFSYLCGIIRNQIYSDHSEVVRRYLPNGKTMAISDMAILKQK